MQSSFAFEAISFLYFVATISLSTLIVCVLGIVLMLFLVGIHWWDRRAFLKGDSVGEHAYPPVDHLSVEHAKRDALRILEQFAEARRSDLPPALLSRLHPGTSEVLSIYQRLTFDFLTYDLDVRADQLRYDESGERLCIGHDEGGFPIYVSLDSNDPKIYIHEGESFFSVMCPSIFHYILRAKVMDETAEGRPG